MRESGGVHRLGESDGVDLWVQVLLWGVVNGVRGAVWGEVVLGVLG